MKLYRNGGTEYKPHLNVQDKITLRLSVAYGAKGSGLFMLSVYCLCVPKNAGVRGGKEQSFRYQQLSVMRQYVPQTTSEEEQRRILRAMADIVSIQQETEYVLSDNIKVKKPTGQCPKENENGIR